MHRLPSSVPIVHAVIIAFIKLRLLGRIRCMKGSVGLFLIRIQGGVLNLRELGVLASARRSLAERRGIDEELKFLELDALKVGRQLAVYDGLLLLNGENYGPKKLGQADHFILEVFIRIGEVDILIVDLLELNQSQLRPNKTESIKTKYLRLVLQNVFRNTPVALGVACAHNLKTSSFLFNLNRHGVLGFWG